MNKQECEGSISSRALVPCNFFFSEKMHLGSMEMFALKYMAKPSTYVEFKQYNLFDIASNN